MDEKKQQISLPHNLILEDRKKLTVTSVHDVESFDEQRIIADTSIGELNISGNGLHINSFSTEDGELSVEGEISSISYSDNLPVSGSFFSRIFR